MWEVKMKTEKRGGKRGKVSRPSGFLTRTSFRAALLFRAIRELDPTNCVSGSRVTGHLHADGYRGLDEIEHHEQKLKNNHICNKICVKLLKCSYFRFLQIIKTKNYTDTKQIQIVTKIHIDIRLTYL